MSKELEVSEELEALENIKSLFVGSPIDLSQQFDIIEKELKEYEMEHALRIRLENINYELVREKQENEKKLKALEIIKEKRVDVELWRFTGNRDSYNRLVCEDRRLTEEEHELLKEVFL